jgi:hypothetical protein
MVKSLLKGFQKHFTLKKMDYFCNSYGQMKFDHFIQPASPRIDREFCTSNFLLLLYFYFYFIFFNFIIPTKTQLTTTDELIW